MASPGFTTRPEIAGTFGVVASTHWIASQVGMAMLEKGGNAFDAAVAAGLVLQVVEPHMNGLGGDAVALIKPAGDAAPTVICGQGPAPGKATIAHFRSLGLALVPGNGLLAACVPGAFDTWMLMLRDHGTMTLAEVMAPAIFYARDGYPLHAGAVARIGELVDLFRDEWKSSAQLWLAGGAPPKPGALHRNPELAETYARLARLGAQAGPDREAQIEAARRAYYQGFVAETIGAFVRTSPTLDASGRRHVGVLSENDMAGWRAGTERPAAATYRGWTVYKAPAWTQGPVMLQVLKLLEGLDVGAMDTVGPDFIHALVEAKKLAYADREAWYGDVADVPLATLLSDSYAAERRKLMGATASRELRPGAPDGRAPRLAAFKSGIDVNLPGVGEPARLEAESYDRSGGSVGLASARAARGPAEGDTCHLDVIDRHGNVVAVTPSGGWLQSSPTVPGLGFCLGTRAQMFWLEEGLPASLAPGRRPRTTLTPSMATRDGTTLAFGSPGGDSQDQWIVQFFLRHVDHGLNLQAAIDQPQMQSDHWTNSFYPRRAAPAKIQVEGRFPAATVEELRRRGHDVHVVGDWSLGRNCAASTDGKLMKGAATPRFQMGYAVGR